MHLLARHLGRGARHAARRGTNLRTVPVRVDAGLEAGGNHAAFVDDDALARDAAPDHDVARHHRDFDQAVLCDTHLLKTGPSAVPLRRRRCSRRTPARRPPRCGARRRRTRTWLAAAGPAGCGWASRRQTEPLRSATLTAINGRHALPARLWRETPTRRSGQEDSRCRRCHGARAQQGSFVPAGGGYAMPRHTQQLGDRFCSRSDRASTSATVLCRQSLVDSPRPTGAHVSATLNSLGVPHVPQAHGSYRRL